MNDKKHFVLGHSRPFNRDELDIVFAITHRMTTHHGWVLSNFYSNVIEKTYRTAVAPKRAMVYVSIDLTNEFHAMLGEFTSAGENVLVGCPGWFTGKPEQDEIERLVDAYVASAEKAISQAYSVRLLRPSLGDNNSAMPLVSQ